MTQKAIWLNDVSFPLEGPIQWRRTTPFPSPFVGGSQEVYHYTPVSVQMWGPFSGGMGIEDWEPGLDNKFWYGENIDTSRHDTTLGPLATTLGTFGVAPVKIIYSQAKVWAIGNGEIAYWSGSAWTVKEPSGGLANPTDAIVYYDTTNGECLCVASAAGGVEETHDVGENWTTRIATDASYLAEFENRLCAISNANTLFDYCDVGDVTTWTHKATFPNLPYACTGLLTIKDANDNPKLLALTNSGMYALDVFEHFYQHPNVMWARDTTAGTAALYSTKDIMYIAGGGTRLLKVTGSVITEWGPDIDDGLPETIQGDIKDIIAVGYWAIIAVDGSSSNKSSILKRHITGGGWHTVYTTSAINNSIAALCWDDGTLYFGESTSVKSLPLSSKTDNYKHLAAHTHAAAGTLYTSWFASKFASMKKVAHKVQAEGEDCTSSEKITVTYRLDEDATWHTLGTINTSPLSEPLEFRTLVFRSERGDTRIERYSVDGSVLHAATLTWDGLHDAAGNDSSTQGTNDGRVYIASSSTQDKWSTMYRSILVFDTSAIPSSATISSVILSLYGEAKSDGLSITPDINIYSAAPASSNDLAAGDFNSLGTTAYCDTAITYGNWSITGRNTFTFNATGKAAISKTGATAIGVRNANYDAADSEPSWSSNVNSYLRFYTSEAGEAYAPILTVTYTGGESGAEFKKIQFALAFARGGTTTNSPKLKKFILDYRITPPVLYEWTVRVNATSTPDRSGQYLLDALKTAMEKRTLLEFYPTGDKSDTVYYVQIKGMPGNEWGGEWGQEGVYVVQIQQVVERPVDVTHHLREA